MNKDSEEMSGSRLAMVTKITPLSHQSQSAFNQVGVNSD